MTMMNMAGMNPAAVAGGPVGGGMAMMNNGSPAMQVNSSNSPEQVKAQLNTYIYEYFLKLGHYDIARSLVREEKFEIRTKPPVKQSPGRRKDAEVNGVDGDAMDTDIKDDIPDDLPRPMHVGDANTPGIGFLFEWFSIFSDLFTAYRSSKMQGGQGGNMGPAAQYLMQHQNMQRMRENQQNQNLRPGMMGPNHFAMRNMRGVMNGNMPREMASKMTPQQMQQISKQQAMLQQQQQMQREQGDVDMNGRASSPAEGENGGSPSKRPRLEGQQFNGGMMPNVRPGMPNVAPQNMMIQNAFNPNMNNAQFRQNGAIPQKQMQEGGMANGMMNMGNAGSPMMQGINPAQFGDNMQMEMYNQRMAGQQMQGAPGGGQSGNHALQDYQMQLMLLEQQNKKRLMMARQEQDSAVNRDGAPGGPMVGMQPMSPSGSRTGTSPNPVDQMKRTPQLAGLPASPSAGDMAGRSPAGMNFMNGMAPNEFNQTMFMKDGQGMVGPGGPNMRPPTSAMDMQQAMARQQQQNRMAGQFPGGQPMVQQPSQGQQQPMGTPGQRTEMPPPQAPAGPNAQRNQPASPPGNNAPPTPSTTNKPNPKSKKAKEDATKKKPAKKSAAANAASAPENEPPATPTPSTPITPVHPQGFNNSAGKAGAPGMPNPNQAPPPNQPMPPQPQMHQPDLSQPNGPFDSFGPDQNFNLDFSTLENSDVLENFDFDSFLNTTNDDTFNFDGSIGVGTDFGLDATNE